MEVQKGYLIRTYQGDLGQQLGQVRLKADEVIDNVLMLYPYGFASRMQREEQEGSMVLLLKVGGSKTNIFGIPYNPLFFQGLEETEVKIGNPKQENTVTFKANGDIEVKTELADLKEIVNNLNTTATGTITNTANNIANTATATLSNQASVITNTASTNIAFVAPLLSLGDGLGLVLNTLANMQVTIPGGSSAGTYPVTIVSAGQTKVSA